VPQRDETSHRSAIELPVVAMDLGPSY
jgi:hypothetical protein